jgi:hypothetical protein
MELGGLAFSLGGGVVAGKVLDGAHQVEEVAAGQGAEVLLEGGGDDFIGGLVVAGGEGLREKGVNGVAEGRRGTSLDGRLLVACFRGAGWGGGVG